SGAETDTDRSGEASGQGLRADRPRDVRERGPFLREGRGIKRSDPHEEAVEDLPRSGGRGGGEQSRERAERRELRRGPRPRRGVRTEEGQRCGTLAHGEIDRRAADAVVGIVE